MRKRLLNGRVCLRNRRHFAKPFFHTHTLFPLGKILSKGIWCSRRIHLQSVRTESINCTNFLSPVKRPACTFALISRNASSWSYTQTVPFLIFKYAKNKLNRVIRVIHPVIKSWEIIKLHIYGECVIV